MATLSSINAYLLFEVKALLPDDDNWAKETTLDVCKLCGGVLIDEEHFHLFRDVGDETWCLDFHYEHAIIESHWQAFQDNGIDGWIPSHE